MNDTGGQEYRVVVVVGTRPEAIKMLPVVLALIRSPRIVPLVISTGQHCTFGLNSVIEGHSQVSPASSRAVFLLDILEERAPETSLAPGKRLEPVHLHGISDTSLHLCLPAQRGQQLTELGWAEPHQYEDFGTEFMIYAPRMLSELDIVLSFIKESLSFARGTTPAR